MSAIKGKKQPKGFKELILEMRCLDRHAEGHEVSFGWFVCDTSVSPVSYCASTICTRYARSKAERQPSTFIKQAM